MKIIIRLRAMNRENQAPSGTIQEAHGIDCPAGSPSYRPLMASKSPGAIHSGIQGWMSDSQLFSTLAE